MFQLYYHPRVGDLISWVSIFTSNLCFHFVNSRNIIMKVLRLTEYVGSGKWNFWYGNHSIFSPGNTILIQDWNPISNPSDHVVMRNKLMLSLSSCMKGVSLSSCRTEITCSLKNHFYSLFTKKSLWIKVLSQEYRKISKVFKKAMNRRIFRKL